jgi:hypothetical protein
MIWDGAQVWRSALAAGRLPEPRDFCDAAEGSAGEAAR